MAEIILRTDNNTLITRIRRVFACKHSEKLSTEQTLTFEVPLDEGMKDIQDGDSYVAEFEGEFYDVVSIKRSMQRGQAQIAFSCEHVSYRLTDAPIAYFANEGSLRETLTKLLSGTGFSCGVVENTPVKAFAINSTSTVRATIFALAAAFGYEVRFHGFFVSMYHHRGSTIRKPLLENNVVSISKSTDYVRNEVAYSCTLHSPQGFELGDEVSMDFERLGIHALVRITGFSRNPFYSREVEVSVAAEENSLEADNAAFAQDLLSQNKNYYGVRLNSEEGLSVTRVDGAGKVILNADEFRMQAKDETGTLKDKLYFDPESGEYKFVGNVSVSGGTIDIGGNFIVDPKGNVYMYGDSTIYGGRYFAGTPGQEESFSQMTSTGFEVYNRDVELKLRFGYTSDGGDYPFIQLGSGSGASADYGLIKKFTDGLWIGNSIPRDASGSFMAKKGYNGIFFRFEDNTAFIVNDTVMANIYTGASIAKFA